MIHLNNYKHSTYKDKEQAIQVMLKSVLRLAK